MYGLIISGVEYMIEKHFGDEMLQKILKKLDITDLAFSSHERYSERIAPDLLRTLGEITGMSSHDIGVLAGKYFVRYMCHYGYGELLKVSGRKMSDFLKGMDSLHEYFRFSYPKIRPPSFYCDRESTNGLRLHYRSRRKGYTSYVTGQLIEIAELFYNQEITISIRNSEERGHFQLVVLEIRFDNGALELDRKLKEKSSMLNEFLPVDSYSFLSMFPFYIAFTKKMEITMLGNALEKIMPDLQGKRIDEEFELLRPLIKFTWDGTVQHLNVLFQLESTSPIQKRAAASAITFQINETVEDKVEIPGETHDPDEQAGSVIEDPLPYIQLRGPMIYLKTMELMVYIPSVTISTLDQIFDIGMYLNDYSNADCNREIIMASVQRSDDLKDLLKKEQEKSKLLAATVHDIDNAKKRARELLRQMMPRDVARSLLTTENSGPPDVVQSFDDATIAFAKVVEWNGVTQNMPAMEVVNLLNHIYSTFDETIERHGVYKVETIGECYMISCGVPTVTQYHAEYCADTCLDMIKGVKEFGPNVVKGAKKVQIKIGMYSGPCVGGVVGQRAPRYCLFGDVVNCASRMESHNKSPMTIQMGKVTKESLQKCAPGSFRFETRGKVHLKGKGEMDAFGLLKKSGAPRSRTNPLASADSDEESERGDVYTPIDNRYGSEASDRESQMSRMSFSAIESKSRLTGSSRMSHSSQNTIGEESLTPDSRRSSMASDASSGGSRAENRMDQNTLSPRVEKTKPRKPATPLTPEPKKENPPVSPPHEISKPPKSSENTKTEEKLKKTKTESSKSSLDKPKANGHSESPVLSKQGTTRHIITSGSSLDVPTTGSGSMEKPPDRRDSMSSMSSAGTNARAESVPKTDDKTEKSPKKRDHEKLKEVRRDVKEILDSQIEEAIAKNGPKANNVKPLPGIDSESKKSSRSVRDSSVEVDTQKAHGKNSAHDVETQKPKGSEKTNEKSSKKSNRTERLSPNDSNPNHTKTETNHVTKRSEGEKLKEGKTDSASKKSSNKIGTPINGILPRSPDNAIANLRTEEAIATLQAITSPGAVTDITVKCDCGRDLLHEKEVLKTKVCGLM